MMGEKALRPRLHPNEARMNPVQADWRYESYEENAVTLRCLFPLECLKVASYGLVVECVRGEGTGAWTRANLPQSGNMGMSEARDSLARPAPLGCPWLSGRPLAWINSHWDWRQRCSRVTREGSGICCSKCLRACDYARDRIADR